MNTKTVMVLAGALAGAVLKDEAPEEGGFDLSAGMFGAHCSEWLRRVAAEIELLTAQRDAWKEVAEHQYGLVKSAKYQEVDYPVTGALDAWAAGRHPVLRERVDTAVKMPHNAPHN